jgi:hypothetical protein
MVKDFHIFVNRQTFEFDDPILDRALSIVKDDEWKRLRSVVRHFQSISLRLLK